MIIRLCTDDRRTAVALVRAWGTRDLQALDVLRGAVSPGVMHALLELAATLAGALDPDHTNDPTVVLAQIAQDITQHEMENDHDH